ncbi:MULTISPECIES: NmrA family NAD(P)-binding protein [unclassified Mycolicibacterium]|uniref:NmrA family NAD(P)-binding protein n=1 Tax=unclassified Mycolicibacterium TaxID=2636767 RepID=UPI001390EBEA|nr:MULTISPECIES: NmrA family NAD(P)-binding protein [unclassified Mycolicibacterium]
MEGVNVTQDVLVTGATGAQGGAVVDALLAASIPVRALVRDMSSLAAQRLTARGVSLRVGSFDDLDSIIDAAKGVAGVFSMQTASPVDPESEVRAATNIVTAARQVGATTLVHTSVARANDYQNFAGWAEHRWWQDYWIMKGRANDAVRASGVAHWVILKPAFMMDNFIAPKATHMFPTLKHGVLQTAYEPQTRLDLIAAADIGKVAAQAFVDPSAYHGQEIDLAASSLTMDEVGRVLCDVGGKSIAVEYVSAEQAIAQGQYRGVIESQQWANVEGYRVDLELARTHHVALESFPDWAHRHRADFVF